MQLYLDCDGVLADFDRGASQLLGMPPRRFEQRHGLPAFWRELARHPDFYGTLPLMADAMQLYEGVRHLDPVILTGLPHGKWAAPQKVRWAAENFPGVRILTVMAVDKRKHAQRGDILVDDQRRHAHVWEDAGGIFIHHQNAASSLRQLAGLGVPVRDISPAVATEAGGSLG